MFGKILLGEAFIAVRNHNFRYFLGYRFYDHGYTYAIGDCKLAHVFPY